MDRAELIGLFLHNTHDEVEQRSAQHRPIESIEVLSHFPAVLIRPQGSRFTVRVPCKGITVRAVKMK